MSRKLTRLVLATSIAAGFTVAPMLGAYATNRAIVVSNNQFNGSGDALPGDTVTWEVKDGEHTVTPKNDEPKPGGGTYDAWPAGAEPPEKTLKAGDKFVVTFPTAGQYFYFCTVHSGMTGVIDVKDQNPAPPPPPPPSSSSSTTTTTTPANIGQTTTTTSAPASSAGAKPPVTAAPAPTTTTAKDKKKDDKAKDEETTTTTLPPPPPVDLPDSAIIPVLPGFDATGTTTQKGIAAPGDTPEGDAIALLKPKKGNGGKAMKLLIVSGVGLGALGIGTAGYKYSNRSSKYFPA